MKAKTALFAVVAFLALGSPLFAHHGSVAYDNSKLVELKGLT